MTTFMSMNEAHSASVNFAQQIAQSGMPALSKIAEELKEFQPEIDDKTKAKLQEFASQTIGVEMRLKAASKAIEETIQESRTHSDADITSVYQRKQDEHFEVDDEKIQSDGRYKRFMDALEAADEAENALIAAAGGSGDEAIDDSLVISQADEVTKDPITKAPIRNPVRNKHCNHRYDREPIMQFIQQQKPGQFRGCPYAGCNNKRPLKESDLQAEDLQLRRRR